MTTGITSCITGTLGEALAGISQDFFSKLFLCDSKMQAMRYYFQPAIVCLIYRLFYIPGSGQINGDLIQISFEDNPFEIVNSIIYDTLE